MKGFSAKNISHKSSAVSSSFVVVMTGMVALNSVLKWQKMVQAALLVLYVISLQNLQLPLFAFGSHFFDVISLHSILVTLPS